jgi:hypothetical protein
MMKAVSDRKVWNIGDWREKTELTGLSQLNCHWIGVVFALFDSLKKKQFNFHNSAGQSVVKITAESYEDVAPNPR